MKDWLKRAMSEGAPDFEPSTSRLLSVLIVLVSLALQVAVVTTVLRHRGPYTMVDAEAFMTSLAEFDASVVSVVYGVNKITTMVTDMYTSKNVNVQSNQPPAPIIVPPPQQ